MAANKQNVTLRSDKEEPLTQNEVDNNFQEIKNVIDDQVGFAGRFGTIVATFKTLTDLKNSNKVKVGDRVQTLGYYEEGDRGGNVYQILAAGTGVHDGGSVINLATTGFQAFGQFPHGVNIRQFGAEGTASIPASTAITSALEYATSIGYNILQIPSGRYLVDELCQAQVTDGVLERGFGFIGEGAFESQFILDRDNTNGFLKIVASQNQTTITVEDIGVFSELHRDNDVGLHNGTAIEINSTIDAQHPAYGDRAAYGAIVKGVHIAGSGLNSGETNNKGRFKRGIVIENMWYPYIERCHVKTVGSDIAEYAVRFLDCYDPRTWKTYARGPWQYGIWHDTVRSSGPSYEGGYISECTIVGPSIGVAVYHNTEIPLYESGFHIDSCHMNCNDYNIHIRHHRHINIENNYVYVANEAGTTELLPAAIWLDKASDVAIIGNQFVHPGFFNNEDNASVSIKISEGSNGVMIDSNTFNTGGIGVYNESQAMARNFVGTNLCSAGQRTGAWAQFVYIVDKAGTLAFCGTSADTLKFELVDPTSTAATNGFVARRLRNDYASNTQVKLSGYGVHGLNSSGNEILSSEFSTEWTDNTDGNETSSVTLFHRRNGIIASVFSVTPEGRLNVPSGLNVGTNLVLHEGQDSGWNNAVLENSWGENANVQYRKTAAGMVSLRGQLDNTNATSSTVFTLPAGFRPGQNMTFIVHQGTGSSNDPGIASVQVNSSGAVICNQNINLANLNAVQFIAG